MNRSAIFALLLSCFTGNAYCQCTRGELLASDGAPTQEFGWAVALDEGFALVGAFGTSATGDVGAAYVYRREGADWLEEAQLVDPSAALFTGFGQAVSIRDGFALVGARYDGERGLEAGAAHLFRRQGTAWVPEVKLVVADGAADDEFGQAVAIDAPFALVGAAYADPSGDFSGAAYLFEHSGATWSPFKKLAPTDLEAGDVFGYAVAIDGDRAVVAAPGEDEKGDGAGAVYVFEWDGVSWSETAKLMASDALPGDFFGASVAIHGDTVLVGAQGRDEGGANAGAAYVFHHDGSQWSEQAKVLASDAMPNGVFGGAVGVHGDLAVVGAFSVASQAGAAYVFARDAGSWTERTKLTDDQPLSSEYFGFAVAVHGSEVLVGAPDDRELGFAWGSATLATFADADRFAYGDGWPGTLGVPVLGLSGAPIVGTSVALEASNSSGAPSTAFVLVGSVATSLDVGRGGTLLVLPTMLFAFDLPVAGLSVPFTPAASLCGLTAYLQVLEQDPGASHGLAFSPGLRVTFGE